jgi:VanZ family protein
LKHSQKLFWHHWLPLLAMLTLITMESTDMMSGAHTADRLRDLLLWAGVHLGQAQLELLNAVLRKSGHVLGYGLLGFFWLLLLRGGYWLQHDLSPSLKRTMQVRRLWWRVEWAGFAVLFTFLVAAADELHQMSIPSRTGCWSDVALDTGAAVAAAALVWSKAVWVCRSRRAT